MSKGVITYWLAGNVPVLGMISLIQGLITKNVNVIKLPRENGYVLPRMITEIMDFKHSKYGFTLKGTDIIDSCIFIYCNRDDHISQNTYQ